MRTKAVPRRALSAAMRMSQARARLRPAPAAGPLIMAIVGFGISCRSREASSLRRSRVTGSSCGSVSPEAIPAISPPAQKPRPAPVRIRQRASLSSATFWMTPGSVSSSSPLRAFSFSGRFSVIVAMPSEMSSRMISDVVVISGLLLEPAPIIWQRERLEKAVLVSPSCIMHPTLLPAAARNRTGGAHADTRRPNAPRRPRPRGGRRYVPRYPGRRARSRGPQPPSGGAAGYSAGRDIGVRAAGAGGRRPRGGAAGALGRGDLRRRVRHGGRPGPGRPPLRAGHRAQRGEWAAVHRRRPDARHEHRYIAGPAADARRSDQVPVRGDEHRGRPHAGGGVLRRYLRAGRLALLAHPQRARRLHRSEERRGG